MKTIVIPPEELARLGVKLIQEKPIIQPESKIAHKWLNGLQGFEVGASADNPFGLDTIAVATPDENDRAFYKGIQVVVCGAYVEHDVLAEADHLPFEDNSQGFGLASHVLEHTSNPIAVIQEFNRVVRDGGYVLMIVPKRSAPYGDQERDYSSLNYFFKAYQEKWTDEQAMENTQDKNAQPRLRGHVWVFNLLSLIALVEFACQAFELDWRLLEAHETDDKDGLGHLCVWQVHKVEPKPEEVEPTLSPE